MCNFSTSFSTSSHLGGGGTNIFGGGTLPIGDATGYTVCATSLVQQHCL